LAVVEFPALRQGEVGTVEIESVWTAWRREQARPAGREV
jgi:hypothetical protein